MFHLKIANIPVQILDETRLGIPALKQQISLIIQGAI